MAISWLLLTVSEAVDANRLSERFLPGGWLASAAIFVAARLAGVIGWLVIASAFGAGIDWRRLRLGGTIVATAAFAYFAGCADRLVAVLSETHDAQLRGSYIVATVANLLVAVGAVIVVSGFAESRRGPARAGRLRAGAIVTSAAYLCATVAELFQQDYYSRLGAPHEATIATTIMAVGAFGLAAAALVLARGATRPAGRREAALAASAGVAVAASLCVAGGEALLATGYSSPHSLLVVLWLAVAGQVVSAVALICLALGARSAAIPAAPSG